MKTVKEIIINNSPNEINIYKNNKMIASYEATEDFFKDYEYLLDKKVKDYYMTIERFIHIYLE